MKELIVWNGYLNGKIDLVFVKVPDQEHEIVSPEINNNKNNMLEFSFK